MLLYLASLLCIGAQKHPPQLFNASPCKNWRAVALGLAQCAGIMAHWSKFSSQSAAVREDDMLFSFQRGGVSEHRFLFIIVI